MVQCFAALSNRLVCTPEYRTQYVFSLRYQGLHLTNFGENYVERHRGRGYYDLESFKTEVRPI